MTGLEIERKFLIKMPNNIDELCQEKERIIQTYLIGNDSERVRKITSGSEEKYTHTVKVTITSATRIESEHGITRQEYENYLLRRDNERVDIDKVRYRLEHRGKVFEIDVYPFWTEVAVMEVELSSEDETIDMPGQIEIIREITNDKRFSNSSIAKRIPELDF